MDAHISLIAGGIAIPLGHQQASMQIGTMFIVGNPESYCHVLVCFTQEVEKEKAFHHQTNTPTPIDLREIIDGSLQIFGPRLRSRGIVIAKRTPQVGRIRGFGGEIQQIISNLLSNSMDAAANDGRIEFRLSAMNGHGDGHNKVRFTIADTGSGISPERLAKVFEPFLRQRKCTGLAWGSG